MKFAVPHLIFPAMLSIHRPLFGLRTASEVKLSLNFNVCNLENLFACISELLVQNLDFGTLKRGRNAQLIDLLAYAAGKNHLRW